MKPIIAMWIWCFAANIYGHCKFSDEPTFAFSCHDDGEEVRVDAEIFATDREEHCPARIKVWLQESDSERSITSSRGGLPIYRKTPGGSLEIMFAFPSQNYFSVVVERGTGFLQYGGGPAWDLKCEDR